MSLSVLLPRIGTARAFRDAARLLASHQVPPHEVRFAVEDHPPRLFDDPLPKGAGSTPVRAPKRFPDLCDGLSTVRSGEGFDVAYALLMRLQDSPKILSNRADPLVARAEVLGKAVRRDLHKFKAFLRFRDMAPGQEGRRRFQAWFEPTHRIEEAIAPFFQRRFGDMDWIIRTPEVTMGWKDGQFQARAEENEKPEDHDDLEEVWRTYYRSVFNPARLKTKAMQAEMPKKYWKNLPEAELIPELVASARAREDAMRSAVPTHAPKRAAQISKSLVRAEPLEPGEPTDLSELKEALATCRRCPLHCAATQAVAGEGPPKARVMVVGEQPGDQEDLAGRPFVGPAGQLFDALAAEAGLPRDKVFVTNAVKHFKFSPRGKRRIHQRPNAGEVSHCRWWLDQERRFVRPHLIVAMGATALLALTGDGRDITMRRGQIERLADGTLILPTFHPSYLLRQRSSARVAADRIALKADLTVAARFLHGQQIFGTGRQTQQPAE